MLHASTSGGQLTYAPSGVLAVKTKGQEDSPIEEVATRIYGGGRGGGKANKELHQLINEVHRENID